MSSFFVVATPIGNLEDITLRAIKVLKSVDLILSEDPKVSKRLLSHYEIETPLLKYHQHSNIKRINYILNLLKKGKNLALITESGTPGISDPGWFLIKKIVENFGDKVKIVPIPGPSALTGALSVVHFSMNRFLFLGFPPVKKKRNKFFQEISQSKYPVLFYESPYRILKTLKELKEKGIGKREILVCRELTKKFESIYRGKIDYLLDFLQKQKIKGEFVIAIEGKHSSKSEKIEQSNLKKKEFD